MNAYPVTEDAFEAQDPNPSGGVRECVGKSDRRATPAAEGSCPAEVRPDCWLRPTPRASLRVAVQLRRRMGLRRHPLEAFTHEAFTHREGPRGGRDRRGP